jgi:hypothetical protein
MSASRSTESEGVDDQKGKLMASLRMEVRGLYTSGAACMSLISGPESANGVSHMRWNVSTKPIVPSQRAPDKQTHFCLRGEKSDVAKLE